MASLQRDDSQGSVSVPANTPLFRITSPSFAHHRHLLTGMGADRTTGRYHHVTQPTTYLSDNILLCVAERLHHLSRRAMAALALRDHRAFLAAAERTETLVVFTLCQPVDVVNISGRPNLNHHSICRTLITLPDAHPPALHAFADHARQAADGLIGPSARHSQDSSVVFFRNQTAALGRVLVKAPIRLSLLREDMGLSAADTMFNFVEDWINHAFGTYDLFDTPSWRKLRPHLHPAHMPKSGRVAYVRTHYANYPADAVA